MDLLGYSKKTFGVLCSGTSLIEDTLAEITQLYKYIHSGAISARMCNYCIHTLYTVFVYSIKHKCHTYYLHCELIFSASIIFG